MIIISRRNKYNQADHHLSHLWYLWRNQMKNYNFVLIIMLWMWLLYRIDIWYSWFKKHSTVLQRHIISQNSTLLPCLIRYKYMREMKNTQLFTHNEDCLNILWCCLIWKMNLKCFSNISMTHSVIFLMFLLLYILMIFWSTHSQCQNTENMYKWFSNN